MDKEKQNSEPSRTKEKCAIWRRRTLLERYLILICLAVLIALLVTIGFTLHEKHIYKRRLSNICLSTECTEEAERIISYMDTSVEPCEDFYNFTCGSYLETTSNFFDTAFVAEAIDSMKRLAKDLIEAVKEEEEEHDFLKKVKRFYQSCLNSPRDAAGLIKQFLEKTTFRNWPIGEDEEANMDSIEKIIALSYIYGRDNPFIIMNNRINSTSRLIEFFTGEMFVPIDIFLNDTDIKYTSRKKKYIELLEYTLFKLKVQTRRDIEHVVDEIIEFETELAKIKEKRFRGLIGEELNMTGTTLKKFSSTCKGPKWKYVIRNIYDHFGYSADFNEEMPVEYLEKEYIEDLCNLLAETSGRTVYNFLVWSLLVQELSKIHIFYRRLILEITYDDESSLDRWEFCLSEIKYGDFGPAADYLVLSHSQPDKTKEEVEGLVEEIKEEMVHMLHDNKWMSSAVKDAAIERLKTTRHLISHSIESLDTNRIEEYFEQFNVTENYMENQLMVLEAHIRRDFFEELEYFGDNIDVADPIWTYSFYTERSLLMPFGYLIPPYFRYGMPKYYYYGSIGTHISRELVNVIQEVVSPYSDNREGLEETIEKFKQKKECYLDQYSNFKLQYNRYKGNSSSTVRDDIADNVGIGEAFKVYKKFLRKNGPEVKLPGLDFTNEQMFFIRYGQSLCDAPLFKSKYIIPSTSTGRYRVTGSLQNSVPFSEVFSCPANSPMNPKNKCHMF